MSAQFVYGRRAEKFIHVSELDPATERGLGCQCVCSECGGALQAHMGNAKAWHFQHHVENQNCNPQPMTLLHAFVRDKIAEKRELWLPSTTFSVAVDLFGKRWTEQVSIPDKVYAFAKGVTELRYRDVQPDVVFSADAYPSFAVEVRKTHAVDDVKKAALAQAYHDVVEFDVSDLPAEGITSEQLEIELRDRRRWIWINSVEKYRSTFRLTRRVNWEQQAWQPKIGDYRTLQRYPREASSKLRDAQKRMTWARGELQRMRASQGSKMDGATHLGRLSLTDRVAVVCAVVGLEPTELPSHFTQRISLGLEHHPYSWQLPIFVAFGLKRKAFTSRDVEVWADTALPDCVLPFPDELSKNNFSRTRASIHNYLLQLESQGVLRSDKNPRHEQRNFHGAFESWGDYMLFAASM